MCYSERLNREAGGYLDEESGRWLLVGYKTVEMRGRRMTACGEWMPEAGEEDADGAQAPWALNPPEDVAEDYYLDRYGYQYSLRRLLRDEHGYHVAATPAAALDAAQRIIAAGQPDGRLALENLAIVRCLVPDDSVDDSNHCHEIYLLDAGERETDADIRAASAGMRRRARHRRLILSAAAACRRIVGEDRGRGETREEDCSGGLGMHLAAVAERIITAETANAQLHETD